MSDQLLYQSDTVTVTVRDSQTEFRAMRQITWLVSIGHSFIITLYLKNVLVESHQLLVRSRPKTHQFLAYLIAVSAYTHKEIIWLNISVYKILVVYIFYPSNHLNNRTEITITACNTFWMEAALKAMNSQLNTCCTYTIVMTEIQYLKNIHSVPGLDANKFG